MRSHWLGFTIVLPNLPLLVCERDRLQKLATACGCALSVQFLDSRLYIITIQH
ncbi:hypothetical protein [Coleofasciculus sp. H7-2]|uniref:hypothetical protein n=1 Tax=Coleofasciculus sp. H7-2 TaxID=3351545 RepID=UPI0036733C9E